jgi:hypothetical protein
MSVQRIYPWARACLFVSALISSLLMTATHASALRRDPLTEKEADLVREAQALDKRTEVFAKAVERRLLALGGPTAVAAATSKQAQKDEEKWGELPQGTRAELLYDISGILDEAVTNIEDVGSHNSKSDLIPKSLRILAEASMRFLPRLTALREQAQEEREKDALERAIEGAQEIIAAAAKLPPEMPEAGKPKKQKG